MSSTPSITEGENRGAGLAFVLGASSQTNIHLGCKESHQHMALCWHGHHPTPGTSQTQPQRRAGSLPPSCHDRIRLGAPRVVTEHLGGLRDPRLPEPSTREHHWLFTIENAPTFSPHSPGASSCNSPLTNQTTAPRQLSRPPACFLGRDRVMILKCAKFIVRKASGPLGR